MKASIIGASGYAGEELIRLLHGHPEIEIAHMTSERHTGERISNLYPHVRITKIGRASCRERV